MDIIEDNSKKMIVTCPNCKSVLRLNIKDILDHPKNGYMYNCAACQEYSPIDRVPDRILAKLEPTGS